MKRILNILKKALKSSLFRKIKRTTTLFFIVFVVVYILINLKVFIGAKDYLYTDPELIPGSYTALIPGASVYSSGYPSTILADRLDKAIELYDHKKIKRFLLSGDHAKPHYDEVNTMKDYLTERGIPDSVIFTDHAGFDTYNSVVRARDIFEVDSLIVVTQKFHLRRAIYIARNKGLVVNGYIADNRSYTSMPYLYFRESFANIKAFFEVLFDTNPVYGGDKIPIKGKSSLSFD
jgi:SanA protein